MTRRIAALALYISGVALVALAVRIAPDAFEEAERDVRPRKAYTPRASYPVGVWWTKGGSA